MNRIFPTGHFPPALIPSPCCVGRSGLLSLTWPSQAVAQLSRGLAEPTASLLLEGASCARRRRRHRGTAETISSSPRAYLATSISPLRRVHFAPFPPSLLPQIKPLRSFLFPIKLSFLPSVFPTLPSIPMLAATFLHRIVFGNASRRHHHCRYATGRRCHVLALPLPARPEALNRGRIRGMDVARHANIVTASSDRIWCH